MTYELVFEAYLNAQLQLVDAKWLADPVNHRFGLFVRNQSSQTLYFKLFNAIPNWDFGTELPGTDEKELGSIGAGGSVWYPIDMVRELPVDEVIDTGNFTLKAYSDADYLNEIDSDPLSMVASIEDIETWDDVTISDFDDGTAQDWTLDGFEVNPAKSVEASGYSLRRVFSDTHTVGHWIYWYAQKSVYIPNRLKCRLGFFYTWAYGNFDKVRKGYIIVYVDGVAVFYENRKVAPASVSNWQKYLVDLTSYKGQTVLLKIGFGYDSIRYASYNDYIDRIVIAGKD